MAHLMEYLQGRGATFTVIPHPKMPTEADEAHPPNVPQELVVKTVVVIASHGLALMVIPASHELNMEIAAEAVDDVHARLATEHELETQFPDYEPGSLPPLSMLLLTPTYVDPSVMARDEIVFAAGRHDVSIRMNTGDLFATDPIVVTPLTEDSLAAEAS